jgi:hypothetical protein
MKKYLSLSLVTLLLAGLTTFTSCKKETIFIPYDLGDKIVCLDVNPIQEYHFFTFDLNHNDLVAALSAAGVTDLSKVKTVKLKKIKAVVTDAGADFDEIATIEVYLKETGASGDGTQIAYTPTIEAGTIEVQLLLNGVEMFQVLNTDMTLNVKVLNKPTGNSAICTKLTQGQIEIEVND